MEKQQKVVDTENEKKVRRYLIKTDPWSSHSIICRWLKTFAPRTRVLDVGTASGALGKNCTGLDLEITGLEPVASWAEEARQFYQEILITSLENAPDTFLRDHDVIVCADILEHLPDPDVQLRRLIKLQKPKAEFLISVPNVANIWVRINLLFGKFDYTDKGILDRTHLRFFTKKSFAAFLNDAGLKPLETKYSPIPVNLVNSFFDRTPLGRSLFRLLNWVTRILPTLLAYQFIVRAKVSQEEITH